MLRSDFLTAIDFLFIRWSKPDEFGQEYFICYEKTLQEAGNIIWSILCLQPAAPLFNQQKKHHQEKILQISTACL